MTNLTFPTCPKPYLTDKEPRLFMPESSWAKILDLCNQACPNEAMWFMQCNREVKDRYIDYKIWGVQIPNQHVTGTFTQITPADQQEFNLRKKRTHGCKLISAENGEYTVEKFLDNSEQNIIQEIISEAEFASRIQDYNAANKAYRVWCHSHVNMPVIPSGTDTTQWKEWKQAFGLDTPNVQPEADCVIMLIVNLKGEVYTAIYDTKENITHYNLPITIYREQHFTPNFIKGLVVAEIQAYKTLGYAGYVAPGKDAKSGAGQAAGTGFVSYASKSTVSIKEPTDFQKNCLEILSISSASAPNSVAKNVERTRKAAMTELLLAEGEGYNKLFESVYKNGLPDFKDSDYLATIPSDPKDYMGLYGAWEEHTVALRNYTNNPSAWNILDSKWVALFDEICQTILFGSNTPVAESAKFVNIPKNFTKLSEASDLPYFTFVILTIAAHLTMTKTNPFYKPDIKYDEAVIGFLSPICVSEEENHLLKLCFDTKNAEVIPLVKALDFNSNQYAFRNVPISFPTLIWVLGAIEKGVFIDDTLRKEQMSRAIINWNSHILYPFAVKDISGVPALASQSTSTPSEQHHD